MAENILTSRQISSLYKEVSKAFSEDLSGQLSIDMNNFKKQINLILKQVKMEEIFHSGDQKKHKGWKILNQTPRKRALMARGYILIFKFRQYLLEEEINYRYYYEDKDGTSHSTTFTENDIVKYVKFGASTIQINPTSAKLANPAKEYNDLIDHFFNQYTVPDENNYMRLISGKNFSGRIVRSNIMKQYEHSNPGLRTNNGRYQMFNKGHIYEAIDTSISDMLQKEQSEDIIEAYVFGKYLARDNIMASRGGDNPITNTSIKSGGADLYDFSTIKDQLEIISNMINLGMYSQEELASIIEKTFLHESKFLNEEDFQNTANKAVNKLLEDMQKQIDKIKK